MLAGTVRGFYNNHFPKRGRAVSPVLPAFPKTETGEGLGFRKMLLPQSSEEAELISDEPVRCKPLSPSICTGSSVGTLEGRLLDG